MPCTSPFVSVCLQSWGFGDDAGSTEVYLSSAAKVAQCHDPHEIHSLGVIREDILHQHKLELGVLQTIGHTYSVLRNPSTYTRNDEAYAPRTLRRKRTIHITCPKSGKQNLDFLSRTSSRYREQAELLEQGAWYLNKSLTNTTSGPGCCALSRQPEPYTASSWLEFCGDCVLVPG